MLKKHLKGFILGVLSTVLVLSLIVPEMASKLTKTAELFYNDIKVVVEGNRAELKDANGNVVEPFIIDGTTYLPVRAVANALEKTVSWDGKTSTVYIGACEEIEQPTVWLKDLETFTGSVFGFSVENVKFGGSEYNNFLTSNSGDVYKNCLFPIGETSYILNGKYSHFKGTFYLNNNFKNYKDSLILLVYLDDTLVYESDEITSGTLPVDFDIDVSDSAIMKLVLQRKGSITGNRSIANSSEYVAFIGNAGLYK